MHRHNIAYTCVYYGHTHLTCIVLYISMLNKNTLGVKKVRGQSEAALEIGMYDQKL